MPELPDITVYVDALAAMLVGHRLEQVVLRSPFVLRSVTPPLDRVHGVSPTGVSRLGKRIVLHFPGELFLVLHLMIAGRLRWRDRDSPAGVPPRLLLSELQFQHGRLLFTEASSTKRASMLLLEGQHALAALDRGGVEPLEATPDAFAAALRREQHTLKRALTDPRLFSGIGNAYSDEILHAAALSPMRLTRSLTPEECERLRAATCATLLDWTARLRAKSGGGVPEQVTAFHPDMAVHGRFGKPCPVCGAPVQRIVYADNECNYCARCQNGGRRLADRAMSRLLRDDWPRSLDELA